MSEQFNQFRAIDSATLLKEAELEWLASQLLVENYLPGMMNIVKEVYDGIMVDHKQSSQMALNQAKPRFLDRRLIPCF